MEKKMYRREKGSEQGVFSNSGSPLEKVKFLQIRKSSEGAQTERLSGRENSLGKGPQAQMCWAHAEGQKRRW